MRRSLMKPPWEQVMIPGAPDLQPAEATPFRSARTVHARILVVDDQATVRDPICRLLNLHGYNAIAAESGDHALAIAEAGPRISLALLDIIMPNGTIEGIEAARTLRQKHQVCCVMLTSVHEAAVRVAAALAGAIGYLVKDIAGDGTILETVELALDGKRIPNPLAGLNIDPVEAVSIFQRKARVQAAWATLTPQQRRVAQLAAKGLTNKEIAEELVVEPSTINTHMQAVLARLGLVGRKELQEHEIYTAALERDG